MTKLNKGVEAVQQCLKLALELELLVSNNQNGMTTPVYLAKLDELKKSLCDLRKFQNPNIQKLAQIANHLTEKMSAEHFTNYIIPLERYLDRSLRDDDFLISTDDTKITNSSELPTRRSLVIILDNIRSAFNVGSIIRLADCVGAREVYLCGYTPGIQNQQDRHISQGFESSQNKFETKINSTVLKTSLNAALYVKLNSQQKVEDAILDLKKKNYKIIALETSKNSGSIYQEPLLGPIALLVGNERFGLNNKILELADEVRHIPMFGVKNSLNVSNAITAAAFEWSRQNP